MASNRTLLMLPGDGIGPEVMAQVRHVIDWFGKRRSVGFDVKEGLVGGCSYDVHGVPVTDEVVDDAMNADAVLLGAVGGPKWDGLDFSVKPERGLLRLRKDLDLFANLRPAICFDALVDASSLKPEVVRGLDILIVRELTGGIYFGEKNRDAHSASDLCIYHDYEVERIVRFAARLAAERSGKLCSVDKANVLESSRLWRDVTVKLMADEFPDIELEHMLVDAASMYLIRRPADFDVIVTENMFGDILTDEASMLAGSMGMLPSASLGDSGPGLYEPIHGSAPDIAGQGIANPCGMLASIAMLLRHSLKLEEEAHAVEQAIQTVISDGARTADIATGGVTPLNTEQMTDRIVAALPA